MADIDYQAFYELVIPRLFEAASYQRLMCGKAENIGKTPQPNTGGSSIHNALSYLDQFTQDFILIPIYQKWPNLVPLVEEDTGLKRSKLSNTSDYALIMDPIDGTAFYLRGELDYSIMLGIMHKGEMTLGLVCYPEKDLIVAAIKNKGAWMHSKDGSITPLDKIDVEPDRVKNIACHYRFRSAPYEKLSLSLVGANYTLTSNDDGFGTNATGILGIIKQQSCAFIGPHIALHDFSVPAFIVQQLGGSVRLIKYDGLEDIKSWHDALVNYGRPDPTGPNPRYRAIIADRERTIDTIVKHLIFSTT